jgi:uncharacterized membrane protein YdfJ with MMPL/SSD domain
MGFGHDPLVLVFQVILQVAGALTLLRLLLEEFGTFIKWFRRWRADVWSG